MGQAERLLERMRANPRDWRISDVLTLCAGFGIACSPPRSGSHYKISHLSQVAILTIPAHRPIKPVYIRALVAFVDAVVGTG